MLWWTLRKLRSHKFGEWRGAQKKLEGSHDARVLAALTKMAIRAAKCSDSESFEHIAVLLYGFAFKETVGAMISALRSHSYVVRAKATWVLGRVGDPASVEALADALLDHEAFVRAAAAEALGQIQNTRAVGRLIATLSDHDKSVRREATRALGEIGDPSAVEAIISRLRAHHEDTKVRSTAARALGKIGDRRAINALEEVLWEARGEVWGACNEALHTLGSKPTQAEYCAAVTNLSAPQVLAEVLKKAAARLRENLEGHRDLPPHLAARLSLGIQKLSRVDLSPSELEVAANAILEAADVFYKESCFRQMLAELPHNVQVAVAKGIEGKGDTEYSPRIAMWLLLGERGLPFFKAWWKKFVALCREREEPNWSALAQKICALPAVTPSDADEFVRGFERVIGKKEHASPDKFYQGENALQADDILAKAVLWTQNIQKWLESREAWGFADLLRSTILENQPVAHLQAKRVWYSHNISSADDYSITYFLLIFRVDSEHFVCYNLSKLERTGAG